MKTFDQIREETREQKFARLRSDAAAFGKEIDAKRAAKQEPVDIFAGSRHSDGKTVQVRNQQTVTPNKPKVGSDDAVGKLLKQKGFDRTGKKLDAKPIYHPDHEVAKREAGVTSANKIQDRVPQEKPVSKPAAVSPAKVQRPFPDKAPEKQFGQDTKMKLLKLNRRIDSDTAKVNKPEPKVGSLVTKQTGYPAAKPKPTVAAKPDVSQKGYPAAKKPAPPKPTPRPEREQSFGQAFAAAKQRGDKEFSWKGGRYNTKVKK